MDVLSMSSASSDSRFPVEDQRLIEQNLDQIINSDTYSLAQHDLDLLNSPAMRGVRMLLEISKPELHLKEAGITSTIIVLGGARIQERSAAELSLADNLNALAADPDSAPLQRKVDQSKRLVDLSCYYDAAREFAFLVSSHGQQKDKSTDCCSSPVIVTGGGPGIMEAGNRGAFDAGCRSIGLNISIPHEPPNPYITPDLCFKFNYLSLRKIHFVMRSVGAILFPGGFGTLDELFEILTLRQVGVKSTMPIILFGSEYWSRIIDFEFMANSGLIDDEDRRLFQYADTALEAWELIRDQA